MKLAPSSPSLALSLLALFLATTAAPASAQNPDRPKQASPGELADAMETTEVPQYPDTAEGLEDLVREMVRLDQTGDKKTLQVYAKSLDLPGGDAWFQTVFGDDFGAQIASATAANRAATAQGAVSMVGTMRSEGLADPKAVKFTDSCNSEATADEYPILLLRRNQEALYDLRFGNSSRQTIWGFFAYVDGGFRFVSTVQRKKLKEPGDVPGPGRVQVNPSVQLSKLIHKVQPDFSKQTMAHGTSGSVVMRAIIGKDGTVRDLSLLEGACGASIAVMNAVRQWRYAPTLVNGEPVEVDTTISLN